MTDTSTPTPGSEWLLPVTMDCVVNSQNPKRPAVYWWMTFFGGRWRGGSSYTRTPVTI